MALKAKTIIRILFLFLLIQHIQAQEATYDSLQGVIRNNMYKGEYSFLSTAIEYDSIASHNGDTLHMGKALNFLGLDNYFKGYNQQAIEYYLKAIPHFELLQDTFFLGLVNNNIGAAYALRKEPEAAISFYEKALSYFVIIPDTLWQANILNNIAVQYTQKENHELAIQYFQQSGNAYQDLDDTLSYASIVANLSTNYLGLNDIDKAYDMADSYINEYKEHHSDENLAHVYTVLGKIYLQKKELTKAKFYAEKSLKTKKSINLRNALASSYLLMSDVNEKLGNPSSALSYYKSYKAAEDSTWIKEKDNRITQLMTEYEVKDKEQKISSLSAENEINRLSIAQIQSQRLLLFIGIISLLLLLASLLALLKQRAKSNRLLKENNEIIQKSLSEKETLLKEIHHRVKNNLQVISSLLGLQSRSVNDSSAVEALTEGQSRVQSMALIHQDLYKTDNLTGIQIEKYIEKLCSNLFNTYNISGDRIQLNMDIEPMNLDVSTLIPMGLILNELISNALKYAFPDERKGQIGIELHNEDDKLKLSVWDDGIGINNLEESSGFGHRLIRTFSKKLDAQIEFASHQGTRVNLSISNFKVA